MLKHLTEDKLKDSDAKSLMIQYGIGVEKGRLLEDKATVITAETRIKDDDLLAEIQTLKQSLESPDTYELPNNTNDIADNDELSTDPSVP